MRHDIVRYDIKTIQRVDLLLFSKTISASASGLCCKLESPFQRQTPMTDTIAHDVWEIQRTELTLKNRLGAGMFGEVWKGGVILDCRSPTIRELMVTFR